MARFRNDTGGVLHSQEFGVIPPGEFEAEGYDPEVHGVIPGCVWLDEPKAEQAETGAEGSDSDASAGGAGSDPAPDAKTTRKRGKGAGDEQAGAAE